MALFSSSIVDTGIEFSTWLLFGFFFAQHIGFFQSFIEFLLSIFYFTHHLSNSFWHPIMLRHFWWAHLLKKSTFVEILFFSWLFPIPFPLPPPTRYIFFLQIFEVMFLIMDSFVGNKCNGNLWRPNFCFRWGLKNSKTISLKYHFQPNPVLSAYKMWQTEKPEKTVKQTRTTIPYPHIACSAKSCV